MKILLPFLAAAACAPLAAFGQTPAAPTPPVPPPVPTVTGSASGAPLRPPMGMSVLTPEERTELMTASRKAQQDPAVKAAAAAMRAAMEAARAAMAAKDPAVKPLLDEIEAASSPGAPRPTLSSDDREKLLAARNAIKGTPEAAAWQKSITDFRAAVRKAMIADDPAVAAIFAKMPPPGMMRRPMAPPSPVAPAPATPVPSAASSPQ